MKMSAQGHTLVFNERQDNPHTIRQAGVGPKHHYTQVQQRFAPIYSSNNKNKLKVITKQEIPMPEIPDMGQVQNNCDGVKV